MLTTYAVLAGWNFFFAGAVDWDPSLAGLDGWWEETYVPGRWCAGLPSWVSASAQPVFGSECALGFGRSAKMSLVFPEEHPRFSGNPERSLSPDHIEATSVDVPAIEAESLFRLDAELVADYPELWMLFPELGRDYPATPKKRGRKSKPTSRKR